MSAFIVSPNTIHKVVHLFKLENELLSCEDLDQLGQQLFEINTQAVAARYPNETFETPPYRYWLKHYPLIECFKALQCLIYQCSEGDVPELYLYERLKRREVAVAMHIVSELPEYDAAPWDS